MRTLQLTLAWKAASSKPLMMNQANMLSWPAYRFTISSGSNPLQSTSRLACFSVRLRQLFTADHAAPSCLSGRRPNGPIRSARFPSSSVEKPTRDNRLCRHGAVGAEGWATVTSLAETAKFDHIQQDAWLRDSLTRMVEGHSVSSVMESDIRMFHIYPCLHPHPKDVVDYDVSCKLLSFMRLR